MVIYVVLMTRLPFRPRDPPGQHSVYVPPGDTARESYRFSTYDHFPSVCPADPCTLAKHGFFYTGFKDRVKCFCCGIRVENWTTNDDVTSGRWHRPDCKLHNGDACGNIPIGTGVSL